VFASEHKSCSPPPDPDEEADADGNLPVEVGGVNAGAAGRWRAVLVLVVLATVVAGCDTWFGDDDTPLPGKRVAVMQPQRTIAPDAMMRADQILLPASVAIPDWPQAGGSADHVLQHVQLGATPRLIWRASIGSGVASDRPWLPPPIAAEGKLFTLDSENRVRAFDAANGQRVWDVDLTDDIEDDDALSGGIAYADGRVIATTGFGQVIALQASTGKVSWQRKLGIPIHAPPAASGGRVFVITVENVLHALDQTDGRDVWPPHRAISETARLLGSAAPAVSGEVVVAPFTSGDLVALRVDNGRVLWSDTLASSRRTDEVTSIAQIRGLPLIDRGRVFATSQGGLLVAIDLRTGQRMWDRDIGSLGTPWLAGRYLFLISNTGDLVCLSADNGRVYWVTPLPRYKDEKEKKGSVFWSGPVLAGDRLIVVGSSGEALILSPFDGRILSRLPLEDPASAPPIVAGGRLFVVTDDGEVSAFQ
jgi:outer membrane protein assembly factor BamB